MSSNYRPAQLKFCVWRSVTKSQGEEEYSTNNGNKEGLLASSHLA
jgi:hypothetical protein